MQASEGSALDLKPIQTSAEVRNRGINGPQRRTDVLQKLKNNNLCNYGRIFLNLEYLVLLNILGIICCTLCSMAQWSGSYSRSWFFLIGYFENGISDS